MAASVKSLASEVTFQKCLFNSKLNSTCLSPSSLDSTLFRQLFVPKKLIFAIKQPYLSQFPPIASSFESNTISCASHFISPLFSTKLGIENKRIDQNELNSFECQSVNGGSGGNENGGDDGSGKKGNGGNGDDESFDSNNGDDFNEKNDGIRSPFHIFSSLWSRYLSLLESHPLIAKAITAGFINVFADLTCQLVFEKVKKVDLGRLAGFFAIGLVLVGPSLHFWYGSLGYVIPFKGTVGVVARLLLDQLIFSPISLGFFIAVLLTLEGRPHEIKEKLKKDWFATVIAQWKLWLPFQTLNFALVPPQLQVGAANLIGLVWTIYLSYATHNDVASKSKLAVQAGSS